MAPEGSDVGAAAQAVAPSPRAEQIAEELSHDLMSPYCPGRTIASCPSKAARELESHILSEAQAGRSRQEIETALVERFGSEIVGYAAQPVVVFGSAAAALVAAVVVAFLGRRWVRGRLAQAAAGTTAGVAATRAEMDRLEDELDELDEF